MTKVKICGITNLEDALTSAKFGADALGFNFYEKSPRYVAPEKAREIIGRLPAKVLKVGVFVNESVERIAEIARVANLDALQLHGEETPEFARELKEKTNLEIIKAFRVSREFEPEDVLKFAVDAILLDAYSPREHGGTGETFDWEIAKRVQQIFPKMYLAGGLSKENVVRAFLEVRPYFLDACSLLEKEKGKKDETSLKVFIKRVKGRGRISEMRDIYDLLTIIEGRPLIYLGARSLTRLYLFLEGFQTARHLGDCNFDTKKFFSEEFHKWMMEKLGAGYPNSLSWAIHIPRKVGADEEKAFDLFFALLEEFKLEKEDLDGS